VFERFPNLQIPLIETGVATGGMQAKLTAACDAIRKGVRQVVVAPGARPGSANLALQKAEIGTRIHG